MSRFRLSPIPYIPSRNGSIIISIIIFLSFINKLWQAISTIYFPNINDWGLTEFLINFQGGFVRRGLLGEILFHLSKNTGWSPIRIIYAICVFCYISVLYFFLVEFKKKKYCWWLIFSPLLCGFFFAFIRKDYLLYCILIISVLIISKLKGSNLSILFSVLLTILALFLHEAYLFWGVPALFLTMVIYRKLCFVNWLAFFSITFFAALLFISHGSLLIANGIIDSWNSILIDSPLFYFYDNSIGSISWEPIKTFKYHLRMNFLSPSYGIYTLVIRLMGWFVIYYFITNFLFVFNNSMSEMKAKNLQYILGSLFIFFTICLLPMFFILSCDWGRLYQYVTVSTFIIFLLVPVSKFEPFLDFIFIRKIINFNLILQRYVVPTKALMVFLLFIIAVSPFGFYPPLAFMQSLIGSFLEFCYHISWIIVKSLGFY